MLQDDTLNRRRNRRLESFLQDPERSLFRLSIPIMFGIGIHVLYSLADMAFVGRLGGEEIAAVTFAGSFFFLMFGLSSVSIGAQALIAMFMGAARHEEGNNAAMHAILIGVVLGTGFLVGGYAQAGDVLQLVGARDRVLDLSITYLKTLFLGAPFLFFSAFARAILVGEGDTKTPVVIMATATLLNLSLDPVLIFVLGWGVAGAAAATLIAMIVSASAYIYVLFIRRRSFVSIGFRHFHLSGSIMWKILRVGIPASMAQVLMALGGMCYHRIISFFGHSAVAGYGLGGRVDMVVALPFVGISTALLSLVGMYHGASRRDLVIRISNYAIKRTLLAAVAIGFLVFVFADPILSVFTSEPEVTEVGRHFLRYIVFTYPMMAYCLNCGRILQGLGLGLPSLVITATRALVAGVPLAYFLTRVWGMGLGSIWSSIVLSGCIATTISYFWLRAYLRPEMCVQADTG